MCILHIDFHGCSTFHGHPSIRPIWKNLQASVERWDPTAPLWTKEVGNCQPIATSHDENIPQMVVVVVNCKGNLGPPAISGTSRWVKY